MVQGGSSKRETMIPGVVQCTSCATVHGNPAESLRFELLFKSPWGLGLWTPSTEPTWVKEGVCVECGWQPRVGIRTTARWEGSCSGEQWQWWETCYTEGGEINLVNNLTSQVEEGIYERGKREAWDEPFSADLKLEILVGVMVSTHAGRHRCECRAWLCAQSCPTLWDPRDCSLTGSSAHETSQARMLEWVDIPFSRGSFQPRDRTQSAALQADSLSSEPPGNAVVLWAHVLVSR